MGQAASLSGTRWGLPSVNEQTCGPNKDKPIWSVDQTYRDTAGSIHNSFMGAVNTAILMMPNPLDCELITSLRKNAMDRQIAVSLKIQVHADLKFKFNYSDAYGLQDNPLLWFGCARYP